MIVTLVSFIASLNSLLGGNLGFTLIVIGVLSRLLFFPLLKKQMAHAKKMRDLQPQLNKLKQQFAKDKQRQMQEQAKLFKEQGLNPAAGCLPMIVQIAIFALLYQAILRFINQGIDTQFLIWDLAQPDTIGLASLPENIRLPGVLIIGAAVTQLLLSKMIMPQPVPIAKGDQKKEKEQKQDLAEDLAQAQSSMVYLFPLMFIFFGYRLPAGLALYWTSTTITAVVQQYFFSGLGGLEPWLARLGISLPVKG
jgi:YidC/Oxa1 family membrane protein insertase